MPLFVVELTKTYDGTFYLTADSAQEAQQVAEEVGLDFLADCSPEVDIYAHESSLDAVPKGFEYLDGENWEIVE